MNYHQRRLAAALAAAVLAGQLTLPAAAIENLDTGAAQDDLLISQVFGDQRLQDWLRNEKNLNGAGADGVLTWEERQEVTELNLSGLGLTSLEGLDAFPNLQVLDCSQNQLTRLDMSQNKKLEGGGFVVRNNVAEVILLPDQPGLTVYLDDFGEQDPIEGHDTVAWYLDADFTLPVPEKLEAAGQILYSKRIANRYTVRFSANGRSGSMENVDAVWGEEVQLPANRFQRYGYAFSHWSALPGEMPRYTSQDWETLTDAYAAAVKQVEGADREDVMSRAAEEGIAAMQAVPTAQMRVEEVVSAWQAEHRPALELTQGSGLTEPDALQAAAQTAAALYDLEPERLAGYSGLTNQEDLAQVGSQAAVQLHSTAQLLTAVEQAAD